jgi:hypothetical protein
MIDLFEGRVEIGYLETLHRFSPFNGFLLSSKP